MGLSLDYLYILKSNHVWTVLWSYFVNKICELRTNVTRNKDIDTYNRYLLFFFLSSYALSRSCFILSASSS